MIHVERQPEPRAPEFDFDGRVRQPGLSALAELTGQPPTISRPGPRIQKRVERIEDITPEILREYDYWTRALDVLHKAYRGICAYSCFYIEPLSPPTTDHFIPISRDPRQAYEWENYRLACSLMNARKNHFPDVLDPFVVQDGWFKLNLDTMEVAPAEGLEPALTKSIQDTINRLNLNSRECTSMRESWCNEYWYPEDTSRPISWAFFERRAPFLAREIRRQGRLRPGDGGVPITR